MRKLFKVLAIICGFVCVILGLIGIFVPLLPTTPFLLLAAFLFARSSDRALRWLLDNRWFGTYIRNYREGRGMALKAKILTLLLLWMTIGLTSLYLVDSLVTRIILIMIASGVTLHLVRIKTYQEIADVD